MQRSAPKVLIDIYIASFFNCIIFSISNSEKFSPQTTAWPLHTYI